MTAKTISTGFRLGMLACITATSLHAYEALQGPTELLYWDKTNAYNGYTWFGVRGTTYLVDNLLSWSNVFTTNVSVMPFLWSDPDSTNFSRRFYRVLSEP